MTEQEKEKPFTKASAEMIGDVVYAIPDFTVGELVDAYNELLSRGASLLTDTESPILSPLTDKPMQRRTMASEFFYKGEVFAIMRQFWLCETGNEFEDEAQMEANTEQARAQYRAKHKLALLGE